MLNSPNEWHNEEDINNEVEYEESYEDEEYDESDGEYEDSEEEYEDDGEEYEGESEDEEYEDESAEEYEDGEEYEEESEDGEEYEDNDEEYEEDDGDGGDGDDKNKRNIIIGIVILLLLLLLGGGIFGVMSMGNKNSQKDAVAMSQTDESLASDDEIASDDENSDVSINANSDNGEEVSIDIDVEDSPNAQKNSVKPEGEGDGLDIAGSEAKQVKKDENAPEEALNIESDNTPKLPKTEKPKNDTVMITIGEVGRKDPFVPLESVGNVEAKKTAKSDLGVGFDVIEPPQLGVQSEELTRLLNTRVTGILYDSVRPSAIVNIDGVDQLVRKGDVISGFEIIAITKNKVIIQSDNNVYRASVGQPLNAEKIVNSVEIANLRTKFWGAENHSQIK